MNLFFISKNPHYQALKNYTISESITEFQLKGKPFFATSTFDAQQINMEIRTFEFGSSTYDDSLNIRDAVLRQPLGMSIFNENLDADRFDFHIGVFQNEQLVGCLILQPLKDGEMKMRQVAVRLHLQSLGIGKEMVQFAELFAMEKKCTKMVLNARKVVMVFYQKLGYETIGEEFTEVGIPHFKMQKHLRYS
jgi:predicted GNAT family N-acyltransferase